MKNRKLSLAIYKLNRSLHRDIGYLTVGFTLIFAVSGIAVNHIQDWNPNYAISRTERNIPPSDAGTQEEIIQHIAHNLSLSAPVKGSFRQSPDEWKIFFDGNTLTYNSRTGSVTEEHIGERAMLFDMNYLHLNHAKKLWTWVSDIFAVFLIFLAVSGLFILKGKQGIKSRGAVLTMIGIAIPVLFILLYRYL